MPIGKGQLVSTMPLLVVHSREREGLSHLKPMINGIPVVWKGLMYFSHTSTSGLGFLHSSLFQSHMMY